MQQREMNILPRSKFSFSLTILLFNTAIETQYIYKRESTFNDIEELFECEVKGTGNECSRDSFQFTLLLFQRDYIAIF